MKKQEHMLQAVLMLLSILGMPFFLHGCDSKLSKEQRASADAQESHSIKENNSTSSSDSSTSNNKSNKKEEKKEEKREDKKDDKKEEKDNKPEALKEPEYPNGSGWIALTSRVNPARPQDEVYLGDWRTIIFGIDDEGRRNTGDFFGMSTWQGDTIVRLNDLMYIRSMAVIAYNDVLPFSCTDKRDSSLLGECRGFEIFVPPLCYDSTVWLIGPLEDAIWQYYLDAAGRHGEGWNPSQVDCLSWQAKIQALYNTEPVYNELNQVNEFRPFRKEALLQAFRENQQLLLATRPPICMAERAHKGGTMEGDEVIKLPFTLGADIGECPVDPAFEDFNAIEIGKNGIVKNICGIALDGIFEVNNQDFFPDINYKLKSRDFHGIISNQDNINNNINLSIYNTQLGNGRELNSAIHKDACALTNVINFLNTSNDRQTLKANMTGLRLRNLFGDGKNTEVLLTSDGDAVVHDNDFWVIFAKEGQSCERQVMAVELLGHREGTLQDALIMQYDAESEDLFLGFRTDYVLDGFDINRNGAFLSYTIHTWDESSAILDRKLREQFASCYLASDPWARQFFKLKEDEFRMALGGENCARFCAEELAEFAVRSQCFSNSRANQRWQNDAAGVYSINSTKNVGGNLIINPGWLGPDLNVEIMVERFDDSGFRGPWTIRRTDAVGQLMVELPSIVEHDRVLIRAQDNCCSDYDLIVPCVPEFVGFTGITSVPYPPI